MTYCLLLWVRSPAMAILVDFIILDFNIDESGKSSWIPLWVNQSAKNDLRASFVASTFYIKILSCSRNEDTMIVSSYYCFYCSIILFGSSTLLWFLLLTPPPPASSVILTAHSIGLTASPIFYTSSSVTTSLLIVVDTYNSIASWEEDS